MLAVSASSVRRVQLEAQGVLVAKECGFDQQKFGRVDQGEAAFPFQEGKRRCNRLAPAKQRSAGIGGVIPRPVESLRRAPVPAVPLPRGSGASLPKAKCVRDR